MHAYCSYTFKLIFNSEFHCVLYVYVHINIMIMASKIHALNSLVEQVVAL